MLAIGCGTADTGDVVSDADTRSSGLTAAQRLAACAQDPRVVTGLVSKEVCAGADIFFRETFDGNGRKCGTCHPAENNTTIEPAFIENLHNTNPNDPLFVFETNPALANLENSFALFVKGNILENVDGFEDPVNKFVVRSVPHVLSMTSTLAADPTDAQTTFPPVQKTS